MKSNFTLFLCAGMLLAACASNPTSPQRDLPWTARASQAGSPVLAKVNGIAVTEAMLGAFTRRPGTRKNLGHQAALDALIDLLLLAQEQAQSSTVQAALAVAELNALASRDITAIIAHADLSEAAARRHYDADLDRRSYVEYRLAHIVLPSKKAAVELLPMIRIVPDFGMAAARFSSDAATAKLGGEMGWKRRGDWPKDIQDVLPRLQAGKVYPEPVKVDGQWQLLLLKGVRHLKPPPFDSVKTGIAMQLKREAIKAHVKNLRRKAKVEIGN